MEYAEIVKAELIAHGINLCIGCDSYHSHSRGFANTDKRTIHYSKKCATRKTLHGFLHEVGHIVNGHDSKCSLRRFEKEAQAEKYATDSLRAYGISVPRRATSLGRRYVSRMKRWGNNIRKGRELALS